MDIVKADSQDEHIITICAFVADVMSRLEDVSSFLSWIQEHEVFETMAKAHRAFPIPGSELSSRSLKFLDRSATALWNAFTRFVQRTDDKLEVEPALIQVPMLVCHMLGSCYFENSDKGPDAWRLFQVLVKCAEMCLGANMFEEAADILHRAAMKANCTDFRGLTDPEALNHMAKYHILCILMALKNGNLKEVESHVAQYPQATIGTSPALAEQYVRICLSALRVTLEQGVTEFAGSLLQRLSEAFCVISEYTHDVIDNERLSMELFDTLTIIHVNAMSESFIDTTKELLRAVEKKYHPSHFLQFEMIMREVEPNTEAFFKNLIRYIENMEPSKDDFKRLLQCILKLRIQVPDKALMALRLLYRGIHVYSHEEHWLQQNFVSLLRVVPSQGWNYSESLSFLNDYANNLNEILPDSLSAAAGNASLIILWKYIESSISRCEYLEAQEWCHFGRHSLFHQANPSSKASILRRFMDCSFRIGDFAEINRAWELLPKQERDPTTIRIMYQQSLKNADIISATNHLASIIELENGEYRYALAAIAATIPICPQLRQETRHSLHMLIEKYSIVLKKKPASLDLHKALLRLIVYEIHEESGDAENLKRQLCEVLIWITDAIRQYHLESYDHDWFVRCTYMLLLEASGGWTANYLLHLLKICLELIDKYPKDVGSDVKAQIQRCRLSCQLLAMLIYTNSARTEADIQQKKSFYADVLSQCARIEAAVATEVGIRMAKSTIPNILQGAFTTEQYDWTISFNLEALLHLGKWTDIELLIRANSAMVQENARSNMMDMILTSDAMPPEFIIRSVHDIFASMERTNTKLHNFIRCIFHHCMSYLRAQTLLCETVLDEAYAIAKDMFEDITGHGNNYYPDEEIEYLSTMSFNYAVDLYLARSRNDAQRWARKAIEFARLMRDDGGSLAQVLEAKYDKWLIYDLDY